MITYVVFIFFIFSLLIIDNLSILIHQIDIKNKHSVTIDNIKNALLIFSNGSVKRFSYPMILSLIFIFSFSAFRYDIGWDYLSYYKTIAEGAKTNIIILNEYATIFLVRLSQKTGITNLYFAVNSFICIFFIAQTIKRYSEDYWISLVLFISFPLFYLNSFSVIRMFSALAITFYGFKFIESKNLAKYIIIVVIACMFHRSAFIAIVFYFIAHYINIKTSKLVIILVSLSFVSSIFQRLVAEFMPRYSIYFIPTSIQEGTKAIIVFIAIGIVALIFRDKIVNNDTTANYYFNIFFVGLAIYLTFLEYGTLGHRFSLYGTIYSILLVPKIASLFKGGERFIVKILIYVFCIILFFYTVRLGVATYIPYRTIWNK